MSGGSSPESVTARSWGRRALDLLRSLFPPTEPTRAAPLRPDRPEPDPDAELREALWRWNFDYGSHDPKEWIRARMMGAHPLVAEVIAIDHGHGGFEFWSTTVIVRLHDGRFILRDEDEEHGSLQIFDSYLECAVQALRHSQDEEFLDVFEPIVAGPFDRTLEGWMDVAADWWDEQGEDFVASELRQVAESRRYRKATAGMTMDERIAYHASLDQ